MKFHGTPQLPLLQETRGKWKNKHYLLRMKNFALPIQMGNNIIIYEIIGDVNAIIWNSWT